MVLYSLALSVGLLVSAPWWLLRMATTERYREGLRQRLGGVPAALRTYAAGRQVVWVHAVSVGEVLAASRLIADLEAGLGEGWRVVVSTTTRTGQALAQERFGEERVFYAPLDFAWAVRAYLRVLQPRALVLMESELWPRMLHECGRAGVPVAVVNARVSDRSFKRGTKMRVLWGRALGMVTLFLAQSEEDARRLVAMGARAGAVRVGGNLKYDVRAPKESRVAGLIREVAAGRKIVVAGSTVGDPRGDTKEGEEEPVIRAWEGQRPRALLVVAPRHPERFGVVEALVCEFEFLKASEFAGVEDSRFPAGMTTRKAEAVAPSRGTHLSDDEAVAKMGHPDAVIKMGHPDSVVQVVLLDTIGDLAAVYGVADVAFVGGSLVKRGGHNPLEPAQFGVPVVIGSSYENFRDIVGRMIAADAIRIVQDEEELAAAFEELLSDPAKARAMGERGRKVFEEQQGATARAVEAIVAMSAANAVAVPR